MLGLSPINRLFINLLERRWADLSPPRRRERLGAFEGQLSIVVNVILAVLKLVLGLAVGSMALISDAIHAMADCLTSVIIVLGFHFSHKEADREHPFGHGRIEYISTLIIAILLIVAGIEATREALRQLLHPMPLGAISNLLLITVAATIFIKEGLANFSFQLSRRLGSDSLSADGWHHRLDAISTVLVLLALIGERAGLPHLDGAVGLLVALLVIWTGFDIARGTIDRLMGRGPDPALLERLGQVCRGQAEVQGIHAVVIHDYGWSRHISLHAEVALTHSLLRAHEIADSLERAVAEALEAHVNIHIDPIDLNDPQRNRIDEVVAELLASFKDVMHHDLRLEDDGRRLRFALMWPPGASREAMSAEAATLDAQLRLRFPRLDEVAIDQRVRFHD